MHAFKFLLAFLMHVVKMIEHTHKKKEKKQPKTGFFFSRKKERNPHKFIRIRDKDLEGVRNLTSSNKNVIKTFSLLLIATWKIVRKIIELWLRS